MKRNPQGKERAYHEKSVLVKHIHKLLQIPFYLNTVTMLFQKSIVIDPSSTQRRPIEPWTRSKKLFQHTWLVQSDAAAT